jgi:hypothetical protein
MFHLNLPHKVTESVNDFKKPVLTPSHIHRPGIPANKNVLSVSDILFSKTRREKDTGEEENEDSIEKK